MGSGSYLSIPSESNHTVLTGGITDTVVLQAAMLHDTVEDTETTLEEIEEVFGSKMRR